MSFYSLMEGLSHERMIAWQSGSGPAAMASDASFRWQFRSLIESGLLAVLPLREMTDLEIVATVRSESDLWRNLLGRAGTSEAEFLELVRKFILEPNYGPDPIVQEVSATREQHWACGFFGWVQCDVSQYWKAFSGQMDAMDARRLWGSSRKEMPWIFLRLRNR